MNRIYQGRVTKVEVLKAGGKASQPGDWIRLGLTLDEQTQLEQEADELRSRLTELHKIQNRNEAQQKEMAEKREALADVHKKLDKPGQDALWEHHQLFQDAVNYYTLCLAAMAEGAEAVSQEKRDAELARLDAELKKMAQARGKKDETVEEKKIKAERHELRRRDALAKWRKQVQLQWQKASTRHGVEFAGPSQRLGSHLGGEPTPEEFGKACAAALSKNVSDASGRLDALLFFLDRVGGGGDSETSTKLSNLVNDKFKFFCEDDVTSADEVQASAQIRERKKIAIRIENAPASKWAEEARSLELGFFLKTAPTECIVDRAAIKRALVCFDALSAPKNKSKNKKTYPALKELRARFKREIERSSAKLCIPKATRTPSEHDAALVFKYLPCKETHKVCLDAFKAIHKRKERDSDPLAGNRIDNKKYFSYFTTLVCGTDVTGEDSDKRCPWFGFDHAAFIAAIQSPHRYFQDTIERFNRRDALVKKIEAMEGQGKEASTDADEETEDSHGLPGLSEDARCDAVEKLVIDLAHYAEEDDALAEEDNRPLEYGLYDNTLRGWGKLREDWQDAVAEAEKKDEAGVKRLRDEKLTDARTFEDLKKEYPLLQTLDKLRKQAQGKKKGEAGSGTLFLKLLEPERWCIWLDPGTKGWHANDPLRAWALYRSLQRDLRRNRQDIRFTPADATHSPRFFNFPKKSESKAREKEAKPRRTNKPVPLGLDSQHVPGEMAFTSGILFAKEGEAKRTPLPVKLTYGAPRLRRDALRGEMSGSTAELQSVPWIQPMMEALGLRDDPTKVNFANCRITFMPEKGEKDEVTVLLGFPVKVEPDKVWNHPKLNHRKRWDYKRSGKNGEMNFAQFCYSGGEGQRNEISLRWPFDIERLPRDKEKGPTPWFKTRDSFTCLGIDLGQRVAAAFARLEAKTGTNFGANKKGPAIASRFIGKAGGKDWHAAVREVGLIRLPGEDAPTWRKQGKGDLVEAKKEDEARRKEFDFRDELWGDRGRPATHDEIIGTRTLLKAFDVIESDLFPPRWDVSGSAGLSFPEMNDKLIVAARRYQSRLSRLHRWCWFLKEDDERRAIALKEIKGALNPEDDDERRRWLWLPGEWKDYIETDNDPRLQGAIAQYLQPRSDGLACLLEDLANRCVPLQGRSWNWSDPDPTDKNKLSGTLDMSGTAKPNSRVTGPDGKVRERTLIRGQRGLSMKRLEQVDNLRRCFQSLNHLRRRVIGEKPPKRRRDDGGAIPDCCPELLEKLDKMKEQRINQTAHFILAKALGLKLAPSSDEQLARFLGWKGFKAFSEERTKPDDLMALARDCGSNGNLSDDELRAALEKKESRQELYRTARAKLKRLAEERDIHGTYLVERDPVDFLVIEDLEYYKAQRGRSARENSRLMKWCRRHLRDKLKQLCEVFGLPVVETNPAFTSRFCSRTGVAGFRAIEVGPGFEHEFLWSDWLERLADHDNEKTKIEKDEDLKFARFVGGLKCAVDALEKERPSGEPPRTLLAPLGSGDLFVPFSYKLIEHLEKRRGKEIKVRKPTPPVQQADINAAVTLAFRAIASPGLWEFHPRCRTKTRKADKSSAAKDEQAEPAAKRLEPAEPRKFKEDDLPSLDLAEMVDEKNPNFFFDRDEYRIAWGKAKVAMPDKKKVPLVSGKALWTTIKQGAWERCQEINDARIRAWEEKARKA